MDIRKKEQIEIDWWRDNPLENPRQFTKENFLNKTQEARHLNYKINKHKSIFSNKKNVLEVGAGQGWASCFLKRFHLPDANYTVTDISDFAIESVGFWENVYDVKIDQALVAKSYDINSEDGRFDLIFCYAAAHHFVEHKKTLIELKRLLAPNGHIVYLYEPTSSKLFYPMYYKYVNTAAHSTPEDVLVPSDFLKISDELNLEYTNHYDAHQSIKRSGIISAYFRILNSFKFIQKYLPSSSDLVFKNK